MRLINIRPRKGSAALMGAAPIFAIVVFYLVASASRHAANPSDKILPTPAAMFAAIGDLVSQVDPLSGHIVFWADTLASLQRLGLGLSISTIAALVIGLLLGLLPIMRASFSPLIAVIAVIPPIALLPILFIVFGLGETAKVALIVIGIAPAMTRDVAHHVTTLPVEQLVKAQTLGASSWQVAMRVALPQTMPRLIHALRLSIGPAWVFLISAEAIASDIGLGYRIFLVRRYLSMDIIIPYVAWTALLAIAIDFILLWISRAGFRWAHEVR